MPPLTVPVIGLGLGWVDRQTLPAEAPPDSAMAGAQLSPLSHCLSPVQRQKPSRQVVPSTQSSFFRQRTPGWIGST